MAKKKSSLGCLFWVALILLILVVFLMSRKRINTVLETTGFVDVITQEFNSDNEKKLDIERKTDIETKTKEPEKNIINNIENKETENKKITIKIPENNTQETIEAIKKTRLSKLYFVQVNDSGQIILKKTSHSIYFTDSPLTDTLKALIQGLSPSDLNQGLLTLIPENTKILGIRINNGTAYINLSEDFRFNSFGLEGYTAQLKQLVYTATEFSTVNKVQILINGKKYDFLSPEGLYIGKPLSRTSF